MVDGDTGPVSAPPEGSFIRTALRTIRSESDRLSLLQVYLQHQAARALGVAPSRLDRRQPLSAFGMDSLTAIELKNDIETTLGVVLPAAHLLEAPNVDELATALLTRISTPPAPLPQALARTALALPAEYPLSHGQRALWFLQQLLPESGAYNIAAAVRIRGDLHAAALEQAFQACIQRHPILRTVFPAPQGEPIQHIQEHVTFSLPVEDASHWDATALNEYLAAEAYRPFDLAPGPLLRVRLLRRSREDHILLLVLHHIVSDFWSMALLAREVSQSYQAAQEGTARPSAPTPQYADYVRWQAELLAGPEGERLWAYWQKRLAGSLPALNLPTDRLRPALQSDCGAGQFLELGSELVQKLEALSRSHSATLYVTLLTCFQVMLYRYTGQEDILVGSPIAGRNRAEWADVLGYFVNPLAMRADLSGNPTFETFLKQVRQTVLAAVEHQDYPFPLLVERLQPQRDLSRSPLFQVMFVMQQVPRRAQTDPSVAPALASLALGVSGAPMMLGGLRLEPLELPARTAQFDLTLVAAPREDRLGLAFQYRRDLFDDTTIARFAKNFQTLLESIVAHPEQTVSALPLLAEPERRQLLLEWNAKQAAPPRDVCIHHLFEAQAQKTPDAVAVVSGDQHVTYRELNRRANQIARYLRALGIKPEVPVGICVERSLEMVVGLFGILKAGGAYLPLDPSYPKERLAFMAADAQVPVLLTQAELAGALPPCEANVVRLDADWNTIAQASDQDPIHTATPSDLAYLIYTSGSTGKPKGVAIEHRSAVAFLQWAREVFSPGDWSGVLATTSICFDLSVFELFGPLSWGGKVILVENALALGTLPGPDGNTLLNTVPSAMTELLRVHLLPPGVRTVNLAGEPLPKSLVDKIYERGAVQRVFNLYGPSEATTYSTFTRVPQAADREPTIGQPIAGTQVYVLDAHWQPVPIGVLGEIYIGGAGLARGYLNRPELTAEKFIPDPFAPIALSATTETEPAGGARLYRTGDLGRWLPDGRLELAGRIDQQVKIRGFRIELGEIESILSQHPAVRESAVVVSTPSPDDKRLMAHVVLNQPLDSPVDTLRRYLEGQLPAYMLPFALVVHDALPRLPNGKVDRGSLAAAYPVADTPKAGSAGPQTPVQQILADIWTGLLREPVGMHDNFFDLGGHSLLATQVVSRVRDVFQIELPLSSLFESPTIARLAERIESALGEGTVPAPPSPRPTARGNDVPLSFAQQRLWFLAQLEPLSPAYNVYTAVRLKGQLDVPALEQSIAGIVRRHETLRTTFVAVDGQPCQRIAAECSFHLPVAELTGMEKTAQEAEVRRRAREQARCIFDLTEGPLFRAGLLQLDTEEWVLLLTMHHIVSDGWSLQVLARELVACYEAIKEGKSPALPTLPIQYADFAAWQRECLTDQALQPQLAFWRRQLAGAPRVLDLPTDRPRPRIQSSSGAQQSVALSPTLTDALQALSRREGATLFMTLLAAFNILLHRYTGQEDLLVGSPIANRNRSEIEGLIGFFANTLVLRTQLSDDPTFKELLARVRQMTLGAYSHQDLPFEKLIEELQVERDQSRSPLFQVMFALQEGLDGSLELPGLVAQPMAVDPETTKFDLMLWLQESARELTGYLEYNADLFDAATIRQMADHFQILLEGIVANPARRISELPLLTSTERQELLVSWNGEVAEYPKDVSIHQLFERQAERTPDAPAVIFNGRQLTFRELNERANQLARHLRRLGVAPENLVGVYVDRSFDMVVGVLAVLKAGGAYVPLDPAYPRERLAFVLQDTASPVLLTHQRLADQLPETSARLVCLDATGNDDEGLGPRPLWGWGEAKDNLVCQTHAENLAYVIYTSGSTGRPKGVAITHRSAVAFLDWARRIFPAEKTTGILAATSLCFDLSVFEIFLPLIQGNRAILVENILQLANLGEAEGVRLVNTVPSAMTELLNTDAVPSSVRVVNLAGEPLPNALARRLYQQGEVQQVYNLYGPSEDTTYSTFMEVERASDVPPPIGRAIANTRVYLLDKHLQLVPAGVPGEIYIGGAGLARGYLHQPALTAERFIPDPYQDTPGSRLYRTGDLARYRRDGQIEFLGRLDHQVKIRGYRIELGEIEATLNQHPGVREAVVMARETGNAPADKQLIAYVVPHPAQAPTSAELHSHLKARLPDYMIPSVFVFLGRFPLTPNGKVDRRVLPAPEKDRASLETQFVSPRNPVEQTLVGLWADVLGVPQVGIYDNFFELGGHSLLATRLVARLRQSFEVELPLRTLFEAPTVADLALFILERRAEKVDREVLDQILTELEG